MDILNNISNLYSSSAVTQTTILSVLLFVTVLAVYEFLIYRFVSHRAFYNKSFNIAIAVLPYFIATIILCLQSNIVITLGTIGALAIIRFRTAVKDPVDMVYLLWSVHTGIMCGCQLYEVAVLTSVVVTVVLFIFDRISFGKRPYILVLHTSSTDDAFVENLLKKEARGYRIRSRNFTGNGVDYVIEAKFKRPQAIAEILSRNSGISKFSIIEHSADDII